MMNTVATTAAYTSAVQLSEEPAVGIYIHTHCDSHLYHSLQTAPTAKHYTGFHVTVLKE